MDSKWFLKPRPGRHWISDIFSIHVYMGIKWKLLLIQYLPGRYDWKLYNLLCETTIINDLRGR